MPPANQQVLKKTCALDSSSSFLPGIDFDKLRAGETQRLNGWQAADGNCMSFSTPSGIIEFFSKSMAKLGFDPLPTYTLCSESPENHAFASEIPVAASGPALRALSERDVWSGLGPAPSHGQPVLEDSPRRRTGPRNRTRQPPAGIQ